MNVSLTPELEALVSEKVQTGRYSTASEVVREALRLLAERDELLALRKKALREQFAEGIAEAEIGLLVDGPEAMVEVRRRVDELRRGDG